MEINNLHIEKQFEKILKPNIVWFVKNKQFQFNDIYLDDIDINYFKSEIDIFKNYLYYFKAENLINSKSISSIRLLFQKRINILNKEIKIFKKNKFIINDMYCTSTNDSAPKSNQIVNLNSYLEEPDMNNILQCKFHYHIFSSISVRQFKKLLNDNANGEFIIQNLKLQLVLQLHYESLNDFVKLLDSIIEIDHNFKITDFKPYFAPDFNSNILSNQTKTKCTLTLKNYEVVHFFYLMYLYDIMAIDKKLGSDKKRADLQRFFEENFEYLDDNSNPQRIVRFQSQLSKINHVNFEENKIKFINKLQEYLDDYKTTTTSTKLLKLKK
jgi:hypothetical protein